MAKETNLDQVKSVALNFLYLKIEPTSLAPMVVSHPFTNSAFVYMDGEIKDIYNNIDNQEAWRKWVKRLIAESDDLFKIILMINKPYILTFLKHIQEYISPFDMGRVLSYGWTTTEFVSDNPNVTKTQLVKMFKISDRKSLMNDEEQEVLASLPDNVIIYRGVNCEAKKYIRQLSWTLDIDKAKWFSNRLRKPDNKPAVYTAEIEKIDILAYFKTEQEVVVDTRKLESINRIY